MKSPKASLAITFLLGGLGGAVFAFYWDLGKGPQIEPHPQESARSELSASNDAASPTNNAGTATAENRIENFDARVATAFAFESDRRRAWEIERLFENMTAEEAPALFAKIMANPDYHAPFGLLGPFFGKWGELDGAAAYTASAQLEGREKKDAEKYLFPAWAKVDVHAAWKLAEASLLGSRGWHGQWQGSVIAEMAKQDPGTLIEFIARDRNRPVNEMLRNHVIGAASEADQLPQLLRKISLAERDEDRSAWTHQIYRTWAAKDQNASLEAITRIEDPEIATAAMDGFLQGWSHSDSQGAIDYALDHRDDPAVEKHLVTIAQNAIYRGTAEENYALVDRLAESGALERIGLLLGATTSYRHPETALRIADKLQDPEERGRVQQQALKYWARNDYIAARAYYDRMTPSEGKADLLPTLASQLHLRSDGGTQLASLLETVPDQRDRAAVIESLLEVASRERSRASKDFLVGLELISKSETELSEDAQALRNKLFGEQP